MPKNKLIIDVHNHLGDSPDGGRADINSILKNMADFGITKSVIFPFDGSERGTTFQKLNSQILDAQEKHPDKLIAFARINPSAGDEAVKEFKRSVKAGARGLKFKAADGFSPMQSRLILDLIRPNKKFPVLMHTSHQGQCTPESWEPVVKEYPHINFIMAHGGKDDYRVCARLAVKYDNLYVETSTLSLHRSRVIYQTAGAKKLLFASDFPYSHPSIELTKHELFVESWADRSKIYYENASSLLGLKFD